jgi:hypothetical protein
MSMINVLERSLALNLLEEDVAAAQMIKREASIYCSDLCLQGASKRISSMRMQFCILRIFDFGNQSRISFAYISFIVEKFVLKEVKFRPLA